MLRTTQILLSLLCLSVLNADRLPAENEETSHPSELVVQEGPLPDRWKDVRFTAIHQLRTLADHNESQAYGEFTLEGPVVDTLRATTHTNCLATAPDGTVYLPLGRFLWKMEPGEPAAPFDDVQGRSPQASVGMAMAYDAKRGLLFIQMADGQLACFDPAKKRWLWRKPTPQPYLAMAYLASDDALYALVDGTAESAAASRPRDPRVPRAFAGREGYSGGGSRYSRLPHPLYFPMPRSRNEQTQDYGFSLVRLDPAGTPTTRQPLSVSISVPGRIGGLQLAAAGSYVVLLVPQPLPPLSSDGTPAPTSLARGDLMLLIEPKTGEVLLAREAQIKLAGQNRFGSPAVGRGEPYFRRPLDEIVSQLKTRLDAARPAQADERWQALEAGWNRLQATLQNKLAASSKHSEEPEIHVVDSFGNDDERARPVKVTVAHADHPVTLVLNRDAGANWRLTLAPEVRVHSVVLTGSRRSTVEGLPVGVPVIDRTAQTLADADFFLGEPDSAAAGIHAELGSEPLSFQMGEGDFEIGPQSEGWRTSYVRGLANALERDLLLWKYRSHRFLAVRRGDGDGKGTCRLIEFSLRGPEQQEGRVLPVPTVSYAASLDGANRALRTSDSVVREQPDFGLGTPFPDPPAKGKNYVNSLSADSKRLLLFCADEERFRYGSTTHGQALYSAGAGETVWKLEAPVFDQYTATAFDPERQVLYGVDCGPGPSMFVSKISTLNLSGAVLAQTRLTKPLRFNPLAGAPQGAVVDGLLVLITPPVAVLLPDGHQQHISQILALDPVTGSSSITGRFVVDPVPPEPRN